MNEVYQSCKMNDKTARHCPHYARKIWKRSFVSVVRPTVHKRVASYIIPHKFFFKMAHEAISHYSEGSMCYSYTVSLSVKLAIELEKILVEAISIVQYFYISSFNLTW